ncbi:hypothetical protein GKC56_03940 [Neisseriaceae bacterium PsAf]|nr:hypothetical protein [Neisseriaceae bacterium PsAf]
MIFKTFKVPSSIQTQLFEEIEEITNITLTKMLYDFNNRAKEDLIFNEKEYLPVHQYFLNNNLSINEILNLPQFSHYQQKLKDLEYKTIEELSEFLYSDLDYILEQQIYGYFEQVINDLVSESHFLFSPYLMAMQHPFTFEEFNDIYNKNHKKEKCFDLKGHVLDYNRFILANYVLKNIKERYFKQKIYQSWLI